MGTSQSWYRHLPNAALAVAFVATVIVGRSLSARPATAANAPALNIQSLPPLAPELGAKPIVILVGHETIVRISDLAGDRVYSVFDRVGSPLATRISRTALNRQFPKLRLEDMRDVTNSFVADSSLLADTPDPEPAH